MSFLWCGYLPWPWTPVPKWKLRNLEMFWWELSQLSRAVRKISSSTTHLLGNILMFMGISDLCKLGLQEGPWVPARAVVDNVIALTAAGWVRGVPSTGKIFTFLQLLMSFQKFVVNHKYIGSSSRNGTSVYLWKLIAHGPIIVTTQAWWEAKYTESYG